MSNQADRRRDGSDGASTEGVQPKFRDDAVTDGGRRIGDRPPDGGAQRPGRGRRGRPGA